MNGSLFVFWVEVSECFIDLSRHVVAGKSELLELHIEAVKDEHRTHSLHQY